MGILVNSDPVDALAMIIHKDFAQKTGRQVCEKLKDLIPRHNFMIPIQAAIGGKIVARESIKGFQKTFLLRYMVVALVIEKRNYLRSKKKEKLDQNNWKSRNSPGSIYRSSQNYRGE